ncbi:MAG TPA: peptidase M28, partial [Alphaproteobacteria bacterium]|nr:peptidase M28 [Alphaproteobacteria bacterium]
MSRPIAFPPVTSRPTRPARATRIALALLGGWLALAGCARLRSADDVPQAPAGPRPLLSDVHQLTFAGRRSGEGYFSRDGHMLVFQSEREPGNPFFQIYALDLRNGQLTRLSTGRGKATCAFVHPGGGQAIFASTHLDPEAVAKQEAEIAAREEGRQRRYAWDYDPHYDIFSVPLRGPRDGAPRRLTEAFGYDAEASYSPDGRLIVFASNRHAFAPGSGVDRERLERDPGYFIDLYVMDAHGREVRRLTTSPGYDGGPFFSPDGTRIVWRRFSEDGALAEIHTMRVDGSDEQAITDMGVMSWAPFYHPSGDYVIFTTNQHGFDDFELYVVDALGRHAPVRVTETPGFDGLPVFSPDGSELVWTSNRTADGTSQLFRARFDDGEARRRLGLPEPAT